MIKGMKKKKLYIWKRWVFFVLLTLFFTGLFFLLNNNLPQKKEKWEEDFIEESMYVDFDDIADDETVEELDIEDRSENIGKKEWTEEIISQIKDTEDTVKNHLSATELVINFIPDEFIFSRSHTIVMVLERRLFFRFIQKMTLAFYEERIDVRGKMKNKTLKIFAGQKMPLNELLAVSIHEFSHYIDIYFFKKIGAKDISNWFYDISWYSTKVIYAWQTWKDFVSGYAMTNKYEDFAETLTYYVFHNQDFLIKTLESDILLAKYNFVKISVFQNENFVDTDFSENNKIKKYYRDITKIPFSTKNFLQYIKKSI